VPLTTDISEYMRTDRSPLASLDDGQESWIVYALRTPQSGQWSGYKRVFVPDGFPPAIRTEACHLVDLMEAFGARASLPHFVDWDSLRGPAGPRQWP
jgi:hypothetical protein